MKNVFIVLVALFLVGCTRPEASTKLLEKSGYTDIEITGYRWFMCSESDAFHTGFEATPPNGEHLEGVVCSGWLFKGATIRFD